MSFQKNLKTAGFILKKINYADADRIYVIFTKDCGKISAIAKGIKKIKSKLSGHIDFFAKINFELHPSKSSELYRITGAEKINDYAKITADLECLTAGFAVLKLLHSCTKEKDVLPKVFALTAETFRLLEQNNRALILSAFQIKLLTMLGYLPSFDRCMRCQTKLSASGAFLNEFESGLLCLSCGAKTALAEKLSFTLVKILNFLQKVALAQITKLTLTPQELTRISKISAALAERY